MAIFSKLNMACASVGIIWPSSTARMRGLTSSNARAWMQRCAQCTSTKLNTAKPALAHLDRQHASLTALGNGTKCTNQIDFFDGSRVPQNGTKSKKGQCLCKNNPIFWMSRDGCQHTLSVACLAIQTKQDQEKCHEERRHFRVQRYNGNCSQ